MLENQYSMGSVPKCSIAITYSVYQVVHLKPFPKPPSCPNLYTHSLLRAEYLTMAETLGTMCYYRYLL